MGLGEGCHHAVDMEIKAALDARLQKFKRQVMKVTSAYHDDGQSIMNLFGARR